MSRFKDYILDKNHEFCFFHCCGSTDDEQCGKPDCPHCYSKTIYEYNEPTDNPEEFLRKFRLIKVGEPHE